MFPVSSLLSRHLRTTLCVALLLLGAGVYAALHLRRELEPRLRTNYAVVTATLPGATAGELLATVTTATELLLQRTPGVLDFDSRTADGVAVLTVRLSQKDALEVRERLRSQLADLHASLSNGIVGLAGPGLDDSVTTTYDLVAGLPAPDGDLKKLRLALPALQRELEALPSVERVEVTGLSAEQIVVEYTDAELADAGFSPQQLTGLLRAQNVVAPGGYLDDRQTLATLHLEGRLANVDALRTVGILDPVTGRATTLDRLLEIRPETRTPPAPAVTVGGKPGVQLAVARRSGADLRYFSAQVRARLEGAVTLAALPKPVVLVDSADFVRREYRNFSNGLLISEGAILLLLVIVMGLRTGGLVALVVPLVLLCTLALLQFARFKLNLVVLAGLTIASGIVADNHIVVAQFVSRRLRGGEGGRREAVGEAFRVLAIPLLAATLTAVAGFLPVLLTRHAAGEYVADLVPVIALALGLSYIFAFALTPFLCPASTRTSPLVRGLERVYGAVLGSALRHEWLVLVLVAVVATVGAGFLWARPTTFFPNNDSTTVAIEVLRPTGVSQSVLEGDMAAVGERIARTLHDAGLEKSAAWMTLSGEGLPRTSAATAPAPVGPNSAVALISLPSPGARARFQASFVQNPLPPEPGRFVRTREIGGGPQAPWPVRVRLTGPAAAVQTAATEAGATLAQDKKLVGLHRETGGDASKWKLTLKRTAAADKSVTPADIALAMNVTLNGLPCFELDEGGVPTPVIVRGKRTDADPVDNLKDAYVYPAKGRPCVLADVAEVTAFTEPAGFERQRGVSATTFAADVAPGTSSYDAEAAAVVRLRAKLTGVGVAVRSAGLAQTAGEANRALLAKIPWALAAVLLVLLTGTRSVRLSLLVLSAVPLGVAGAGFGLTLAGLPTGFMPLIGLTATAGIVVNIAIVMAASLAERSRVAEGCSEDGIIRAATDRVEPIVLSALCTVGGAVPLFLFGGPLWQSMAVTLVAGLLVATVFLVILLPAAYKLLFLRRVAPGRAKSPGTGEPPP